MKEIVFTKGFFRASQGISLDPRHYEAIMQIREICKQDPRLKAFKLSEELKPLIATLLENKCSEIEEITGFNPLNGIILPYSQKVTA
jgi:hypothetical protein